MEDVPSMSMCNCNYEPYVNSCLIHLLQTHMLFPCLSLNFRVTALITNCRVYACYVEIGDQSL